ncbi:MAG: hypothetical protein MZV63_64495 [Marinilabiliales bacterium]|nr:hypothetical protein [Marinilabiliales bacterium]
MRVPEKNKHGDNHAMAFVPGDPDYILNGSDGGVYETHDRGETWRFFENLPVTQFYKLALDNALPFYNVHGGAQDNGSQMGPSRTLNWQRHLELRLDDHLRRRRLRDRRRPDRPGHGLSRVAGGQPPRATTGRATRRSTSARSPARATRRCGSTGTRPSSSARTRTRASTTRRSTCGAATTAATRGSAISPDLTRNIFRLDAADHGPHVERRRAVGPRRDVDVLDDHRRISESPLVEGLHLRGDRRWADPGDGGRGRDVAEDREAAGRARQLLRQRDPGVENRQGRRVRGRRLPQDGRLRALPAAQRRPRAHVDVDRRRPAGADARVGRRAGPREARPAVRRDGVRHLRHARRREELAQARRRRADHLVPRHRDPGARERPRGRVVRAQLLRARRLLAAAADRRGGAGRGGDRCSR